MNELKVGDKVVHIKSGAPATVEAVDGDRFLPNWTEGMGVDNTWWWISEFKLA